jgi:hypothetical protein
MNIIIQEWFANKVASHMVMEEQFIYPIEDSLMDNLEMVFFMDT